MKIVRPICHCTYEITEAELIFGERLVVAHHRIKDSTGGWMAMTLNGDVITLTDAGV